jgi:hypothetical protein
LSNLAMIENLRRAEDHAWRERLKRQQVLARPGRMFDAVHSCTAVRRPPGHVREKSRFLKLFQ